MQRGSAVLVGLLYQIPLDLSGLSIASREKTVDIGLIHIYHATIHDCPAAPHTRSHDDPDHAEL